MKLRDMGEGGVLRRIRERFGSNARDLLVGIGDDAAVIDIPPDRSLVICSDLLAENTHFIRHLHPPSSIAYRAIAANVSDVAAMGGDAAHFVVSLAAPGDLDEEWLDGFFSGVERACRNFDIVLAGGDSSSSEHIFVDVAMIGFVGSGQYVLRSGAKVGDGVYVTGVLGSSALGLELLKAGQTNDMAVKRHLFPEPRRRVGPAAAARAHAMTDISDGLSTDLGHILQESKVSAKIYKDRLPAWPGAKQHHVLHGGEEYELIIAAPELPPEIEGVALSRIGEIIPQGPEPTILLVEGETESVLAPRGWEHFA